MLDSNAQLKTCVTITTDMAGDAVHRGTCIRYVGAFLDETLTF